jgi:hypothetical protein
MYIGLVGNLHAHWKGRGTGIRKYEKKGAQTD